MGIFRLIEQHEIKNNLLIGDAFVADVNPISVMHDNNVDYWDVRYTYNAGGKIWSHSRRVNVNKYKKTDFVNKHFPVVYSALHPSVSDILVNKNDSVKYGVGIAK